VTTNRTFRTGCVWRHLSSRRASRVYLWCFAVLLISGLALRLEAVIYGRQIISVVSALSTLRVGETSKAETLSRLPMLRTLPAAWSSDSRCGTDECLFMFLGNGLPGRILWETKSSTLSALLRWWGFRFEILNVGVNFTSGKVSYFAYSLWASAPGVRKDPPTKRRRTWGRSYWSLVSEHHQSQRAEFSGSRASALPSDPLPGGITEYRDYSDSQCP
jgi:hypothetical protein